MSPTFALKKSLIPLLSILSINAVHAQEVQKQKDVSKEDAKIDTVIVTANRRDQFSQKVSGVVQSVSGEQLRKDGITEFRNLQDAVPGLNISVQEGAIDVYIRGVGTGNNTELGDPGAAPHLNGIFIPRPRGLGMMFYDLARVEVNKGPQGTLYGRNAMAGTLNMITVQPKIGSSNGYVQGDIQNRNGHSFEAALNIPLSDSMAMRAAVTETKRDAGFKNVSTDAVAKKLKPAGLEDSYGGRLSFLWNASDDLKITAMADAGKESGTGYPVSQIYEPLRRIKSTADDLNMRNITYRGNQGESENEVGGFQTKAEYNLGSVTAELSASVRTVDFHQRNASNESVAYPGQDLANVQYDNFGTVFWVTKSKSQIYEMRFSNSDDKQALRWSTGLFHFKEKQKSAFFSLNDNGAFYSGTEFTMPKVDSKSTAIFLDGTLDVAKDTRLIGGLRYTSEDKYRYGIGGNYTIGLPTATGCCTTTRFGTEGFVPALLDRANFDLTNVKTKQQMAAFILAATKVPGARDNGAAQIGPIANGTSENGGFAWSQLGVPLQQVGSSDAKYGDFRLGFEHDLNKDQMLYAKASTGHKAGGFNDSLNSNDAPITYKPERLTVYEIGSRNAFNLAGRRTTFNVTGFYYDYKDQVLQDLYCQSFDAMANPPRCNGYSLINRNIASSNVYGLELESRLKLSSNLALDLNAAFLKTKINSGVVADSRGIDYSNGFKAPTIDLAGNELPLASKINLTARLMQKFALGSGRFDWQVLVNYRSAYFLTQFNERDLIYVNGSRETAMQAGFPDRQKGYATVNLGLGYEWDNWRLEGFGANLTNVQASHKEIVGNSLNLRFLNDARTYGIRLRNSF